MEMYNVLICVLLLVICSEGQNATSSTLQAQQQLSTNGMLTVPSTTIPLVSSLPLQSSVPPRIIPVTTSSTSSTVPLYSDTFTPGTTSIPVVSSYVSPSYSTPSVSATETPLNLPATSATVSLYSDAFTPGTASIPVGSSYVPPSYSTPSVSVSVTPSSTPNPPATSATSATTDTTSGTTKPSNPGRGLIRDTVGLAITGTVCLVACLILSLLCCCIVCCCVVTCRVSRRRHRGYKKAEVLGDYPDDDSITARRFMYQRMEQGPATESFELATLGSRMDHFKRKILPDHFKKHLDTLWSSEHAGLREEFDALEVSKMRQPCNAANLHSEIQKNKDFKLVPYDHNRVKIKTNTSIKPSDYINASYIRAPHIDQLFIAAQAPMDNTINDFWQLVSEQSISNMVMLAPGTNGNQLNLPSEGHPVKHFGQLEVSLELEEKDFLATFRRFKVKNELGNVKHVVHAQFKQWTARTGVPKFHQSFVKFIRKFKQKMINDTSPVMVYSTTGSGQTGVFLATYTLMELTNKSVPFSVFDVVLGILEQRMYALQTLDEYKFLHLVVLELICDTTSLMVNQFPDAFRTYVDSLRDSYKSIFHQQFAELDYQVDKTYSRSQEDALNPINRSKNTTPNVLPYDDTRVSLFSEFWEAGDYINASYIDGHMDPQYFIATIHPVRDTILEFLQMVYQCSVQLVVLLATEEEYELLETGLDGSVCYWGEEKQGFGMYSVETVGSTSTVGVTRNKIKIINHSEKSSHTFVQYICTNFLDTNKPTNSQPLIHLADIIFKFKQEYTNSPIVVHCWDGIGKTGVLMGCCLGIQELIADERVDLFHIVKCMRRGREKMVSPVDLYISCFEVINDFIIKSGQVNSDSNNQEFTVKVNV